MKSRRKSARPRGLESMLRHLKIRTCRIPDPTKYYAEIGWPIDRSSLWIPAVVGDSRWTRRKALERLHTQIIEGIYVLNLGKVLAEQELRELDKKGTKGTKR